MSQATEKMTAMTTNHELREWAKGIATLEAATEMLIRADFAQDWRPWVRYDEERGRHWIDFAVIPEEAGGMSGGQQRFLRIAASLGSDAPVIIGDEVTGLDRKHVQLVLAAIAHAAGMATDGRTIQEGADGVPHLVNVDPLYTWPE